VPLLSDYIIQTRRLLHDATGQYWSDAELTDYINTARLRVVSDTGCNRVLQIGAISANVEQYSFGGVTGVQILTSNNLFATVPGVVFTGGGGAGAAGTAIMAGTAPNLTVQSVTMTSGGTGYTGAPAVSFTGAGTATATAGVLVKNTLDILNATLQWGAVRIPMNYMAYTQLNRDMRGLMQYTQRPVTFSVYGQNAVFLGPVPDQMYIVEWDSVVIPANLVLPADPDVIIMPYTDPIPFYAAYLAKFKEGEMTEADRFRAEYVRKAKEALGASFTRRIVNQYAAG
jgi:hypothetical protein